MSHLRAAFSRTFQALEVRNFRLFFIGQLISLSGTWMQAVAQAWLVLNLTGSAVDLGITTALAFLPMLVAGSFGGLVVDRFPKRRILLCTQTVAALLALTLGLLTTLGRATVWDVYVMAFCLGMVNLFDVPARQAFVQEMVGRDLITNAVSLNSVLVNSGRIIGPAIGGLVISGFGIPACFFINAASFVGVIVALALMRVHELTPIARVPREKGQVREGLRYAFGNEEIRSILIVVALTGVFAYNFTVTIPLLVRQTFGGTAADFGIFSAMTGVGAVVGGLFIAHRARPSAKLLAVICSVFAVAASPTRLVALVIMVPLGASSTAFISTANATLQMLTVGQMRGRVMALFSIGFLGSTPIGAPLVGLICGASTPRVGFVVGGCAVVLGALLLWISARGTGSGVPEVAPV